MERVALIVGIGPGIGQAVAKRFALEGLTVAMASRTEAKIKEAEAVILQENKTAKTISLPGCDVTDPIKVKQMFDGLEEQAGKGYILEAVVYNAASRPLFCAIEDMDPEDFHNAWKGGCYGAFLVAQHAVRKMKAQEPKGGTLLFTGATAALRGGARFADLAVSKFGLRALTQSLAREHQKNDHIHCCHIIIDGLVHHRDFIASRPALQKKPLNEFLQPDQIAEQYWNLHNQHESVWTLEMDLRPFTESF